MLRALTDTEVKQIDKDMDEWWSRLNPCTKHNIYYFVRGLYEKEDLIDSTEKQKKIDTERSMANVVLIPKDPKEQNGNS